MDIVACGIKAIYAVKISGEITVIQEERSKHLHAWLFPWLQWMDELYPRGIVSVRGIIKDKMRNATPEDIENTLQAVTAIRRRMQGYKQNDI